MPLTTASVFDNEFDVCVVGAGPAGLACAFDCHDQGLSTLLLEAGDARPVPGDPDVLAAEIAHPAFHDPTSITAAHALGGSTHWWGGRSVPFDPADFDAWPLRYDDLLPWWDKAAAFLGSRSVSESPPPASLAALPHFDAARDECWGAELLMSKRWRARIAAAEGPAITLGARVVGMTIANGRVSTLRVRAGGATHLVRAKKFVLTGGGLGTLKLLLLAQREHPALFGANLGRGYMGHLTGTIASLTLNHAADAQAFACRPLGDGVFARRRFRPKAETVRDDHIFNIAFWLDNGAMGDAAHGSSVASARYLAARMVRTAVKLGRDGDKSPLGPHIANVARAPVSAFIGLTSAAALILSAKLTGRHPRSTTLTPVAANTWRMDYHAEQPPHADNRVSLADTTDSVGNPKLKIELRMRGEEIESVVRAHELLDADLKAAGAGALTWSGTREECIARVRASARDGYHQIGGAAMGANADSVVDTDLKARGLDNLYLAAGCVLPTGSQANPTLTIVALARRLAAHLGQRESVRAAAAEHEPA
ncbi:GMC family oxidoreductase [Terricaulis sp.]|uniref:GMC family oxidoreductase n=1 Tax=Terricaulis sp. TaxID=2768686 RepID=UPI003784D326